MGQVEETLDVKRMRNTWLGEKMSKPWMGRRCGNPGRGMEEETLDLNRYYMEVTSMREERPLKHNMSRIC